MTQKPDHFKQPVTGEKYAGDHLLLEFWGAENLTSIDVIREALELSATAAGATLLHSHYHRFGDGGGVIKVQHGQVARRGSLGGHGTDRWVLGGQQGFASLGAPCLDLGVRRASDMLENQDK